MGDQDWAPVVIRKKKPNASQARSKQAVNAALRSGAGVSTQKKYGAGGNKQKSTDKNTAVLDAETEKLAHKKVPLQVGQTIMKARNDKGLNRKDFATKINEKPAVVQDYETGKAIPNQQTLSKMERVLGVKLRGKNIGEPLPPRGSKAKKK
ncbi:multiprotein bridging factor [Salpingoeca rosetta]|uniref:Multiprotein bridging factor n=1 Tax=Salpingoeca rosetta (strain ATCC 50818 / BSB-021) TaxID=946362 RepID=F2UT43_SALR5|nr:multiprotein bridging factor [Salpingoeca rosetta]EGD81302.1 multiprotein bridging factor [Salpingoeca rosetta]|eukprot:XP_004987698.1 multiprotein bridging factor [Salpingoeca rosetta]